MTAHDTRMTRIAAKMLHPQPPRHPLDELTPERQSGRLVVFTPSGLQIDSLLRAAQKAIGGPLASPEAIHRVISHNPDSLWAIARRRGYRSSLPVAEGFVAYLMLNRNGMRALFDGSLNVADPDLSKLAQQNEKPAGIYVWCVHAPGVLAGGMPLTVDKISTRLYRDVDIYARAATAYGLKLMNTMGFEPGAKFDGIEHPTIHVYRRKYRELCHAPIYDDHNPRIHARQETVTIARTLEDMMRVMTIRSAVYVAEQACPYDEEFDGNDFTATHLIGYVGDEPAACLRIRYFADFAKVERLAVRREFRKTRISFQISKAAIELCRAKGYRRIYAHAQKRLLNFFDRLGFRPLEGGREFVFSDFDYIEIVLDTTPHPQAIALGVDPYIMIRPEGRWHIPGVLERSAVRPVTRPSVDRPVDRSSSRLCAKRPSVRRLSRSPVEKVSA